MKKDPNIYPKGWTAARIKKIADFYDHQTDDEAAAEIESAERLPPPTTWIEVPNALVPEIKRLLQKRRKSA